MLENVIQTNTVGSVGGRLKDVRSVGLSERLGSPNGAAVVVNDA